MQRPDKDGTWRSVRIDHIALWTNDIDRLERFYAAYVGAAAGPRYVNKSKGLESSFLSFSGGTRLELLKTSSVPLSVPSP
jgi:lactoylglutathione lyase